MQNRQTKNVLVLGRPGVGKHTWCNRMANGNFSSDIKSVYEVSSLDEMVIRLHVATKPTAELVKGKDMVIVMYSILDNSINDVEKTIMEVNALSANGTVPKIMFYGNKVDRMVNERQHNFKKVSSIVLQNFTHAFVSAKSSFNIHKLWEHVACI